MKKSKSCSVHFSLKLSINKENWWEEKLNESFKGIIENILSALSSTSSVNCSVFWKKFMATENKQLWSGYLCWCWNMDFSGYLQTLVLGSWLLIASRLKCILSALIKLWYFIVKRLFSVKETIILKIFFPSRLSSPLKHCKVLLIFTLSQLRLHWVCESCWCCTKASGPTKRPMCTFTFKLIDWLVVLRTAVIVMACCTKCSILLVKAHFIQGSTSSNGVILKKSSYVGYGSCLKQVLQCCTKAV